MKIKLTIISIITATACCFQLSAQDSVRVKKPKEIFVGLGSGHYRGDLGSSYSSGRGLFTLGIKLNTAKKLNGNLILSIGSISGNELDYSFDDGSGISATPNSFFKSNFIGLNYEAQYNIVNKEKFKLYIAQGIGAFRYTPRDEFGDELSNNTETRALNETYGNITIILPTSLGAKYILPNKMSLGVQAGFFNTVTDYLDNISDWGQKSGNDNILNFRFNFSAPINI